MIANRKVSTGASRIRVIQVAHWPHSGLTAVMRDIARALRDDVDFMFVELGATQTTEYYGELGEHLVFGLGQEPVRAIGRFASFLREAKPDLIHVHSLQPLLWTSLLASRSVPVVATVHSEYEYLRGDGLRDRTKRALHRIGLVRARPHVVAVADGVAERLRSCGLAGKHLWKIENAIVPLPREQLPEFRRRTRKSLGVDRDEILIVSAGRLQPVKGFDLLIQAFATVLRSYDRARLVIAGEGDQRGELEASARRLGVAHRVELPGHVSPLLELLAGADLFVMSSRIEGCPLAFAEAMSCEVPVVATPVGTAPGILGGRYGDLLAPAIDADAIAQAMLRALAPDFERERVGRELANSARCQFELGVFGDRYRGVYDAALRGPAG